MKFRRKREDSARGAAAEAAPPTREEVHSLALARLGFREHSAAELNAWLLRKHATPDDAAGVVADLVSRRYLDDSRYARMLIRDQVLRGKGAQVIRQKLKLKGITMDVAAIKLIAEEAGGQTDLQQAIAIVDRRYSRFRDDRKEAQRAYGALIRRGFSFDVARQAVFNRSSQSADAADLDPGPLGTSEVE